MIASLLHRLQDAVPEPVQDATPEVTKHVLRLPDHAQGFFAVGAGLFVIFSVIIVGAGILLLTQALMPNLSDRAVHKFRSRQLYSALGGFGVVVIGFIFAAVGAALPIIAVIGLALFTPVVFLGWTAASEALGRKLFLLAGREASRPTHVVTGWTVLLLASCVPFLGWLIIAPYALMAGMGSVMLGFFSKDDL